MQENSNYERSFAIDFDFIDKLQGEVVLFGFVPDDPLLGGQGVTVASIYNLGTKKHADLRTLGLNPTLIGKLYPYLEREGENARDYLHQHPLILTENEASAIIIGIKRQLPNMLAAKFDLNSDVPFVSIAPCWQTVIASLESQYGDLQKYCPAFWNWVVHQKWDKAITELRDFGDGHSNRRNAEADYILAHCSR